MSRYYIDAIASLTSSFGTVVFIVRLIMETCVLIPTPVSHLLFHEVVPES